MYRPSNKKLKQWEAFEYGAYIAIPCSSHVHIEFVEEGKKKASDWHIRDKFYGWMGHKLIDIEPTCDEDIETLIKVLSIEDEDEEN